MKCSIGGVFGHPNDENNLYVKYLDMNKIIFIFSI